MTCPERSRRERYCGRDFSESELTLIRALIAADPTRTTTLANGITDTPRYTHPTDFKARISSPQIAQFVELIRLLDQLMIAMDTL